MIEKLMKLFDVRLQLELEDEKKSQYIFEIETSPNVYGLMCIVIKSKKIFYYTYNLDDIECILEAIKNITKISKVKKIKDRFDCFNISPLENVLNYLNVDNIYGFRTVKMSPKVLNFYGVEVC